MSAFDPDAGCTLTDSLVAFYKLEEASGIRFDSIVPGTDNAGQFTRANSESLSIADNASLSTGDIDFTIAIWVYLDSKPGSMSIINKQSASGASNSEYSLVYDVSSDKFAIGIGSNAVVRFASAFGSPPIGEWIFIVAWHDAAANTLNIQVNNGTAQSTATAGTAPLDTTALFNIGAKNSSPIEFFDGRIDEVGFWKRVLTSHEREDLYNNGNGLPSGILSSGLKTSLISYWDLDETSGTRVDAIGSNDLTDNNTVTSNPGVSVGNSLTDNNTVTQAVGIVDNAAQFTAANSEFLSIADNADLSTGDIDFTIAGWFYLDTKSSSMVLASKRDSNLLREYSLSYSAGLDRFSFTIFDSGGVDAGQIIDVVFGAVSTGVFIFIVAWHDSVANTVNIQVNNGTVDSSATTGVPSDTVASFLIGAANSPAGDFFDGRIDEVGFWKKVLTTQERTDLYNSGLGNTFDSEATCVISRKSDMILLFD